MISKVIKCKEVGALNEDTRGEFYQRLHDEPIQFTFFIVIGTPGGLHIILLEPQDEFFEIVSDKVYQHPQFKNSQRAKNGEENQKPVVFHTKVPPINLEYDECVNEIFEVEKGDYDPFMRGSDTYNPF
jgi:hypothetical protein